MTEKPGFFTDTHIGKQVAIQLREKGIHVVRCQEVDLADADDQTLLAYAAENNLMMLSCDHGFRNWGFTRIAEGKSHTGILLFDQERHCQNIGRMIKIITLFYELSDMAAERQNRLYEAKDFEA